MPNYFLSSPIAGNTTHFLVTYSDENDADAHTRAEAIVETCESDLAKLQKWFQCNLDDSPYNIWVHVNPGVPHGGAWNMGHSDCESSVIVVEGTYNLPTHYNIVEDFARMLFVAELAEILMDFTRYGWNRGDSAGEALSHVAAAEFYSDAYYAPGAAGGPFVNRWLRSDPRPNWVNLSEDTDGNAISYGCGILFINYLVYQLGYSFSQVVTAGASNLAETFKRLTGQPEANAFKDFSTLLERHLPQHLTDSEKISVKRDNVFPLYDVPGVSFVPSQSSLPPVPQWDFNTITLKAGTRCEPKEYVYMTENITTTCDAVANAYGTIDAEFSWALNGVPLQERRRNAAVSIDVQITDTTPAENDPILSFSLAIAYYILDDRNSSRLTFTNQAFPGNCEIEITVEAREGLAAIGGPKGTHKETVWLETRGYAMDKHYHLDLYNCSAQPILEMATAVAALNRQVFILLHTPDPGPEQIVAIARSAMRYSEGLKAASLGSIGLRTAAAAAARRRSGTFALPGNTDLPGIQGGRPIRVVKRVRDENWIEPILAASLLRPKPTETSASLRHDFHYWIKQLADGSFALTLAVIVANWAVFGSVDGILQNRWSQFSIATVISALGLNLLGIKKLSDYVQQRDYRPTLRRGDPLARTSRMEQLARCLWECGTWLPILGGILFLVALFTARQTVK